MVGIACPDCAVGRISIFVVEHSHKLNANGPVIDAASPIAKHVELHSLKPLRYVVLWGVRGCIDSTFVVECLVLWYGICS